MEKGDGRKSEEFREKSRRRLARLRQDPEFESKRIKNMKGVKFSEEGRRNVSRSKKAYWDTHPEAREEMSREHGGVMVIALPLILRGATNLDISDLSGLKPNQIEKLKQYLRRKGEIPPLSPKETGELSGITKRRLNQRKKGLMPVSESHSISFGKELLGRGLITGDLTYWNLMVNFYEKAKRPMPELFTDRLRLELFLTARLERDNDPESRKNPNNLFNQYVEIGQSVSVEWFDSDYLGTEQLFIRDTAINYMHRRVTGPSNVADNSADRFRRANELKREYE